VKNPIITDIQTLIQNWDGCGYIDVSSDPVQAIHG
jgi:hypothetical protein